MEFTRSIFNPVLLSRFEEVDDDGNGRLSRAEHLETPEDKPASPPLEGQ